MVRNCLSPRNLWWNSAYESNTSIIKVLKSRDIEILNLEIMPNFYPRATSYISVKDVYHQKCDIVR